MTHVSFELPAVRVVSSTDYKGNPVTYVSVCGVPMLYAFSEAPEGLSVDTWEDIFKGRLARVLAPLLLAESETGVWSLDSPTGREVNTTDYLDLVEDRDTGRGD